MKLHIKGKVVSVHARMDVLDEQENVVYQVSSKALSIHDKTYIKDAEGNEIAYIHAKALSLHQTHYVEMANGVKFEVAIELGHLLHRIINIKEMGWQIKGEFASHDYEIIDSAGRLLATAHRKWFSMHNIYYLDINQEDKAASLVAAYIVLEHILASQEASSSSSTTVQNT